MSESHEVASAGNGQFVEGAILAKLAWGMSSDPGPTRDHNEDFAGAFALSAPDDSWDRGPVFAVADGMGGHAAGEVASRLAVETLIETWKEGAPAQAQPALRSAARAANMAVVDAGMEAGRRGMGTTLTAVALAGHELVLGHVGDSRAYLVRHEMCTQLTTDHSRVAEMVRMKLITAEQATTHPARSQLTRSLGGDPFVQVDLVRHDLRQHDVLVLCSDGLWDVVSRQEIAAEAQQLVTDSSLTPAISAERLTALAVKREAADNVTAVVIHVTSDQPIPPAITRRSLFRRNRT